MQNKSWHMAPFKGGLMWSDLPGFPPTLTVGSIVPLNETSWLSSLGSRCRYRRTTRDTPRSLQPTATRLRNLRKRRQHFSQTRPEGWRITQRQQEANLLSLQLIFHLSPPLILSPGSHVYIFFLFFRRSLSPAAVGGDCCQFVCWQLRTL